MEYLRLFLSVGPSLKGKISSSMALAICKILLGENILVYALGNEGDLRWQFATGVHHRLMDTGSSWVLMIAGCMH